MNECCKEREYVIVCQAIIIDSKENTRMENTRSCFVTCINFDLLRSKLVQTSDRKRDDHSLKKNQRYIVSSRQSIEHFYLFHRALELNAT